MDLRIQDFTVKMQMINTSLSLNPGRGPGSDLITGRMLKEQSDKGRIADNIV